MPAGTSVIHCDPDILSGEPVFVGTRDAYLLTCALQQRAPLLTLDTGLIRTANTLGIDLVLPAT